VSRARGSAVVSNSVFAESIDAENKNKPPGGSMAEGAKGCVAQRQGARRLTAHSAGASSRGSVACQDDATHDRASRHRVTA
jgi:hypothetical protein